MKRTDIDLAGDLGPATFPAMQNAPDERNRARYLMIGGFLGAGKTTTIQKFAQYLDAQGLKVGLITNDQGAGLVDSALGRSNAYPVEEISGGCFCCRFNTLLDAAKNLTAETRPDVFLAEPVGSCTDLVATVSLPMQKIYGEAFQVAPMSVMVDPVRALRIFGWAEGKKFSDNVRYIYEKQLEEAEHILINKIDLLDAAQLETLRNGLAERFPEATIHEISAREDRGMEPWFDAVMNAEIDLPRFLDIDYQRYGDGEAQLGWLNSTIELRASDANAEGEFDGNQLISELATALRESLAIEDAGAEIAHLKMTLTPLHDPMEIAAVNLVRDDTHPELSHQLVEPIDDGELLLNIRAEASPEALDEAVKVALAQVLKRFSIDHTITHAEHFRPGMPNPTHRMTH